MSYELVVFDLDGVLLDSRQNMEASWSAVQQGMSVDVPFGAYFSEIGKPFADIMDILGLGHRAREIEKCYMSASIANFKLLRWFDGIEPLLTQLAAMDIKMAIVTSKDRQRTVRLVEQLPVEFSTIQTPVQGLRGKPAPDHVLVACAHANSDPASTVFVGDMPVDHEAAQRSNVAYAHAAWGYGKPKEGQVHLLSKPADLLALVAGSK